MKRIVLPLLIAFCVFSCKKEDSQIPMEKISTALEDTVFRKGNTYKLKFTFSPANATSKVAWTSSDENIIEIINDSTALAKNIGRAVITVTQINGSNLNSSKAVYVYSSPTVSIGNVSEVTYYTARFAIQSDNGGDNQTYPCLFWDTVPKLDTAKCLGRYKLSPSENTINLDMFDPKTQYYAWIYTRNIIGKMFSDSAVFKTTSLPSGVSGNYMLNIPLAWGTIAKYNDWIYYVNRNDDKKLYKIKSDLTGNQKISDLFSVFSLNIIGSNIYLAGAEYKGRVPHLIKIKLDGTNLQDFTNKNTNDYYYSSGASIVNEEFIYTPYSYFRFSTTNKLSKPSQSTVFFDDYLNIYNNKLYFCLLNVNNVDSLYTVNECNLDGTDLQELYRGYNPRLSNSSYFGIYEGSAYFREHNLFKKIDLKNPGIIEVLPIRPISYNIVNYSIFFSNANDSNKLYKSDLEGLVVQKICDDKVYYISVIDDWLYYYNYDDNRLYRIKQNGTSHQLVN